MIGSLIIHSLLLLQLIPTAVMSWEELLFLQQELLFLHLKHQPVHWMLYHQGMDIYCILGVTLSTKARRFGEHCVCVMKTC